MNEKGINCLIFILESPKILIPSSSGNGEAIIIPPIKKEKRRKSFNLRRDFNLPFSLICLSRCSENLSLTNLNINPSIMTAPSAPNNAVSHSDPLMAISPNATVAGAVVNTDVKNIPAIKLPSNSCCLVEVRISPKNSIFTRRRAIPILNIIITKSKSKDFVLLFISSKSDTLSFYLTLFITIKPNHPQDKTKSI